MSSAAVAKTAKTPAPPSSVITASGDKALFSRLQAGLEGALPNEACLVVQLHIFNDHHVEALGNLANVRTL